MRIDECQDSLMDTLKFLFLADSNQDRREKLESMLKKESILFQRIEKAEGSEISGELSGIKENSASDSKEEPVNILAGKLNPDASTVLLCAHYDVFAKSSGANDNLSSCAILFHLLKRHPETILVCFTDQEETGHGGARLLLEWLKKHAVESIIVLDTCGYGNVAAYRIASGRFCRRFRKMTALKMKKKYRLHPFFALPESDDRILASSGFPVMLLSVMPESDVLALEALSNAYGILMNYASSYELTLANLDVMGTIHGGAGDRIESIQLESMQNVLNHLEETLF